MIFHVIPGYVFSHLTTRIRPNAAGGSNVVIHAHYHKRVSNAPQVDTVAPGVLFHVASYASRSSAVRASQSGAALRRAIRVEGFDPRVPHERTEQMYALSMNLPASATTESIAFELERAARQLRQMSSLRAAHSMVLHGDGCTIRHGVLFGGEHTRG